MHTRGQGHESVSPHLEQRQLAVGQHRPNESGQIDGVSICPCVLAAML